MLDEVLLDRRLKAIETALGQTMAEVRRLGGVIQAKVDGHSVATELNGLGDELDDHAFTLNELRERVDEAATKQEVEAATAGVMDAAAVIATTAARQHVPRVIVHTIQRDEKGRMAGVVSEVQKILGDVKP